MNKRWLVNKTNKDFLEYLSRNASVSTAIAQILVNRGIKDIISIKDFLFPSVENLHSPFLMPDMGKAVERIKTALASGETVLIHGDYDADGITSTALMVSALRTLGLKTHYYIPDRIIDGYGFSKKAIRKAQDLGAGLIITVDCGISAEEEVLTAASHGIDVIITDHHKPPKKLPDAVAVINPHRMDSEYPFKNLAGVGVAYKLAQAITEAVSTSRATGEHSLENVLSLVAVGTIGDSVPLTGENRILVTYGIKALNNSTNPWIDSLKETSGTGKKDLRSGILAYTIIPRINAAGRLGDANQVVELFLTEDESKAKKTASFLEEQNRKRQRVEGDVLQSALDMIDDHKLDNAIVLYSPAWHQGVIGIVASRLAEMFYRPTFLFSLKDSIGKGSARSIPQFDLYNGISQCEELLIDYGGHQQAAGLKIHVENIPQFKKKINSVIENTLTSEDMMPTITIDAGIELFEINFNLVRELALLEPFGNSNQNPVLGAKGIEMINPRVVGNNHLKMKSRQKSVSIDTIGFCMADYLEKAAHSPTVDIAFSPCINEWNGGKALQLNLKALRLSL
ncbi:MAG: single-stranded-DNA-specific exonuclease RecJ [Thermodesulfovibrionia bacterium]|nr:single-stranded-DNA-specific exonuclease RecJ [Thermodesulfovibrionia bacterium]